MIRLIPLNGQICEPQAVGRATYQPDADGTVRVPGKYAPGILIDGNYGLAPDEVIACDPSTLPGGGCVPGMQVFSTVTGKPVWRNAANSAWVFADGTAGS